VITRRRGTVACAGFAAGIRPVSVPRMGVWGTNVFDNDMAADFAAEFDESDPSVRVDLLRSALEAALDAEADDLDEFASEAVGAAAIIAATLPADLPLGSMAPHKLDGSLSVPADLVALAVRAFDRVMRDDFDFAEMWDDDAFAGTLRAVRTALGELAERA
jgi:hypothetical protein